MKFIKKDTIFLITITMGLILISILGLSYTMSKGAEQKVYMSINSYVGKKGDYLQGLNLAFKREDISCFGLVKFDCTIKNAIVNAPKEKINIFDIDEIKIGSLTKDGLNLRSRNMDLYAKIKGIRYNKNSPLTKDITKEGLAVSKYIFPFNIDIGLKLKKFKNNEARGTIKFDVDSKILDFKIKTNIAVINNRKIVYLNKDLHLTNEMNATAAAKLNMTYNTIIEDFSFYIKNNNLKDFLYTVYSYYFSHAPTKNQKLQINTDFIGVYKYDKVSKKEFIKNLKERLKEIIPDADKKETKEHIEGLIYLIEETGNKILLTGKNKDNFSAEELSILNSLDELKKPWDYFDLQTKKQEKGNDR